MKFKICKHCKRNLEVYKFKHRKGIPYYICKECEKIYMKNYRDNNKEHLNRQHSEYMKRYRENSEVKEKMKTYSRNYQRNRLHIEDINFRGPNKLEKGQTKYSKSQILKMSIYGLTPEQFDNLPESCEVCGATSNLCIDHDHNTGNVRGVLCHNCNIALGHLKDNCDIISNLLIYLKQHKK